ncbi:MAG: hypothetical protein V3T86_10020, partial [Planctomycetota bacterium]
MNTKRRSVPWLIWVWLGACLCLSPLPVSRAQEPADEESGNELLEQRSAYIRARRLLRKPSPEIVTVKKGGSAEKALRVYNEWGGGPDAKIPDSVMRNMYEAAGGDGKAFKTIALLVDKGLEPENLKDPKGLKVLKIHESHSQQMARKRELWIEQKIEAILKSKKGQWRVARSDSGNPDSGMKSDLDQTFYLFKRGPQGQWVRDLGADAEFIRLFNELWNKTHPTLNLNALDIASIDGRNRFPDPRDIWLNFETKFVQTTTALRRTPGAYTYAGAVVQQMQARALQAILNLNKRSFQVYSPDGKGGVEKLPFDAAEAQRHMFGITPELRPAHAFGAAVANYLELVKYMRKAKFETKYHLRVWDDCGFILKMKEKNWRNKREYMTLDADAREKHNKGIIDSMFPDATKRQQHRLALDISAKLRLLHKGDVPKVFPRGAPPTPAGRDAAVFDSLARDIFGDKIKGEPTKSQINAAKRKHRQLASEFCMESVYKSSVEAFRIARDGRFKDPLFIEGYEHLMKGIPEATLPKDPKKRAAALKKARAKIRQNVRTEARLTLLYAVYDLGMWKSGKLMHRVFNQLDGVSFRELATLWVAGRAPGFAALIVEPEVRDWYLKKLKPDFDLSKAGRRAYAAELKKSLPDLNKRVQARVLTQLGFNNVAEAKVVNGFLRGKKLTWSPARFARHMVWDPGSIDALARIVRVYVTSKGDMEAVRAVTVDEIIMAVPIGGQLYAATKGGVQGLVLMAGAIQFPIFGVGLLIYSIGDSGYAIYDSEYVQHAENNLVDACYRGFVGPATRVYDNPPPQFTENDAHLLKVFRTRLDRAIAAKDGPLMEELEPKVRNLTAKKQAFEAFRDGSWAGGYFSEWGAQKVQKRVHASLLAGMPPIVSYSPMGMIDFRANHDPKTDNPRIEKLMKEIEDSFDAEAMLKKASELDELLFQKDRYERALRYLSHATGASADSKGLSQRERRQGVPELLLKLRRDSLYPALKERAVRLKDERGNLSTPNPDTFVDDWIHAYGKRMVAELVRIDVLSEGDTVEDLPVQALKDRVTADYLRSKRLWEAFRGMEERRAKQNEIRLQKRLDAYEAEAAGRFVEGLDELPTAEDREEWLTAMRIAAVRRNAPRVKATVYRIHKGEDENKKPIVESYLSARIQCDPRIYPGPHHTQLQELTKEEALAAAASGEVDGIPILKRNREALKIAAGRIGEDETVPLVSAFSETMADLSKALPSTVRHLPGIATKATERGILLDQIVLDVRVGDDVEEEEEPEPEPEREVTAAKVMVRVTRDLKNSTPLQRSEYVWEAPSSKNLKPERLAGSKLFKNAVPYVWVSWPNSPKSERGYPLGIHYRMKTSGGIPNFEQATHGTPTRDHSRPGAAKDTVIPDGVLAIPIPMPRYTAGTIRVDGELVVFEKRKSYKEVPDAEGMASLPFSVSLVYERPELSGEGSVRRNDHGDLSISISIKGSQPGSRVAEVVAGGTYFVRFSYGA